jgi:sulfite reductase subunit B
MTTLLNQTLRYESIYMPTPARIVSTKPFTAAEKWFKIELPSGFELRHSPGQFVEVSVLGVGEAPISVCSSPTRSGRTFELLIRNVGKLTNAVHQLGAGSMLGIRGPFGRPFPVERFHGKHMVFIAGGLGLAPLRSLIDQVHDQRGRFGHVTLLYGTKTPEDMLFRDDLVRWADAPNSEVHITVERPNEKWVGNVGVITKLIPKLSFDPKILRNTVVVIIGPPVMYKFVLRDLVGKGVVDGNIWVSFERQMKCAVGKCGHCQMHHIYTCQDGPSFSYDELQGLEEAF